MARTASAAASTVLSNIVNALADEQSLERGGRCLQGILDQLAYAGVKLSTEQVSEALDEVAECCPSAFAPYPEVSSHYTPWGTEWRFRRPEAHQAARACIEAVYRVTDTLDRTEHPITLRNGTVINIETVRPHAFAVSLGHLRVRWAQGNFEEPSEAQVRRWVRKAARLAA